MTATATGQPTFTGFHHDGPVVRDIDASAAWYERVLGVSRSETPCPEDDGADGADGVVLSNPESGVAIRLQGPGPGRPPSHTAFSVASRAQLDTWAGWLDGLGVLHGGVVDVDDPETYAYLVFRDPDDVPLVLVHVAG